VKSRRKSKKRGKAPGKKSKFSDSESDRRYPYARKRADCSEFDLVSGEYKGLARQFDKAVVEATEISDEEESDVGRKFWDSFVDGSDKKPDGNGSTARYVRSVGAKIARGSKRPGITYKFFVVHDDTINAFAMPGGHIVVYDGLLKKMENEAQLAFVLGHEVSHVELRHTISNYQLAKQILGEVDDLSMTLVWYGRLTMTSEQEKEADAGGLELMLKQGYSPFQSVGFMGVLPGGKGLSEQFDIRFETGNPFLDAILRQLEDQFLDEIEHMATTHPKPEHRACLLKQEVHEDVSDWPNRWYYLGKKSYARKAP